MKYARASYSECFTDLRRLDLSIILFDMRAFVAIAVPHGFRTALAAEAAALSRHSRHVRAVESENMHLTLAFLANLPDQGAESVRSGMEGVASGRRSFSLGFEGGGAFPNIREPRVGWAGLSGELEALSDLQNSVIEAIRDIGLRVDRRPFSPHITLLRIGRQTSPSARTAIGRACAALDLSRLGRFSVSGISLMESTLTDQGAINNEVFEVGFSEIGNTPRRRRFGIF